MSFSFWADNVVREEEALARMAGAVIAEVKGMIEGSEYIEILTDKGTLALKHHQDCCESVSVEDVVGDPSSLVGARILEFREDTKADDGVGYGDAMWTFYNLITDKEDINIRWYGHSNGYYGIGVSVAFNPDMLPPKPLTPEEIEANRVEGFMDEAARQGFGDWN